MTVEVNICACHRLCARWVNQGVAEGAGWEEGSKVSRGGEGEAVKLLVGRFAIQKLCVGQCCVEENLVDW